MSTATTDPPSTVPSAPAAPNPTAHTGTGPVPPPAPAAYPPPTSPAAVGPHAITVTIVRVVREGCEADFERLLRTFIPVSLTHPGHLGVHVLKPAPGEGREYRVVVRFCSREKLAAFRSWPPYQDFERRMAPLLEAPARLEEMTGLESWFTMPGSRTLQPLPRHKIALLTLTGVFPTSLALTTLVAPAMEDWHVAPRVFVLAATMVGLLTWGVMPVLNRTLGRLLHRHPDEKPDMPQPDRQ